jgi:hypothetical protein
VFDDITWTFQKSITIGPGFYKKTAEWYTPEQIKTSHNGLFCKQIVDNVSGYKRIETSPRIAAYRKIS